MGETADSEDLTFTTERKDASERKGASERRDAPEKSFRRVVDYVNREIHAGHLRSGDRLPPERELSEQLGISRNSVREGLRVLENIGILSSRQGSGNFVASNFDDTMTDMLASMYLLKGITESQLTEYRFAIEWEAMHLAVLRVTEAEKEKLQTALRNLEQAETESDQIRFDREIHQTVVDASRNEFLITSYRALTNFMDQYIGSMRKRIISGMQTKHRLEETHRLLVEGVTKGSLETGLNGIRAHFDYIDQYKDIRDFVQDRQKKRS